MYIEDLALNNLQGLICNRPNKTKQLYHSSEGRQLRHETPPCQVIYLALLFVFFCSFPIT